MISVTLLGNMLLIFCARITDVSLGTFRILQLVKGKKLIAATIGFFEIMIYMAVLGHILGGGKALQLPELIAYCAGYATGNFIGAFLENRLISSYTLIEAIAPCEQRSMEIIQRLREEGYGTTVINGEGKAGPRYVIKIVCSRKDIQAVTEHLKSLAFVTIFDVKSHLGGYFRMKRK